MEYYETPTLLFFEKGGKPRLYHERDEVNCWCDPNLYYDHDGNIVDIEHQKPN